MDYVKTAKEVVDALKPIAQKIGEGAEAVYKMAVKDAYITGVESTIYSVLGLLGFFFGVGFFFYALGIFKKDTDYFPLFFVSIVSGAVGFLVFVSNISPALHNLLNPEYQALVGILHTVGK